MWFNAIAIVLAALELTEVTALIPASGMGLYAAVVSVGNLILRMQTSQSVTLTK
jgi:hypothetical protein